MRPGWLEAQEIGPGAWRAALEKCSLSTTKLFLAMITLEEICGLVFLTVSGDGV